MSLPSRASVRAFCNVTEPEWNVPTLVTDNDDGTFDPTVTNSGDLLIIWWWGNGDWASGASPGSYDYLAVGEKLVIVGFPESNDDITALTANNDDLSEAHTGVLSSCATINIADNGMTAGEVDAFLLECLAYADTLPVGTAATLDGTNAAPGAAGLAAVAILTAAPYNWVIVHT